MKFTFRVKLLFFALIFVLSLTEISFSNAHADVPVPMLTGRVIDQTHTLTATQQQTLEQTLKNFEEKKGTQLAVLLIASTSPEAIEQYSLRVVEQWRLGRKQIDDGVLLIIAKEDRSLRIEVGYGLEGALNDATSKRIISEIITPQFKQGNFYGGITAGVTQIIRVLDGEPLPEPNINGSQYANGVSQYLPIFLLLTLVLGGILRALMGRSTGAVVGGALVVILVWFLMGVFWIALVAGVISLVLTFFGGGVTSALLLGGFGGGRGGFGGGGGGFGGGGASGRW